MEQPRTALAERIAERRRADGDPRALVGEMRRSVLLVPVAGGGLWSVRAGGVRWVCGFTDETPLARFARHHAPGGQPVDHAALLGARIVDRAQNGQFKKYLDYHGDTRHGFSDERVLEILKNPDAVYHSTGTGRRLTFRQGEDIVVVDGPGNTQGQAITAYGPSGVKGESGAEALGGKATDPGAPVTHEDIVNGRIPTKDGYQPPAVQIR